MITFTTEEKKELRSRVLHLVEHGLPLMVLMPVPAFVREQSWYMASDAGEAVKIYALPSYKMPTFNGKLQPALKACLMDEAEGKLTPDTVVIGASSSNWAMQMGLIRPIFGYKKFAAVVNVKSVSKGKLNHLEASGADIIPVPDGTVGTDYVYELVASHPNYHLIDQYVHPGSVLGHRWTMEHIAREIKRLEPGRELSFFGAISGTCSTLRAAREFLRPEFPHAKIWGVASQSKKEKVPAARTPEDIDELKSIGGGFNYRTAIDGELITSVLKHEAFEVNAELVQRYHITAGPTGALLLAGIWNRLGDYWKEHGNFDGLKNSFGEVLGAIFIVDMHLPYLDIDEYRQHFVS